MWAWWGYFFKIEQVLVETETCGNSTAKIYDFVSIIIEIHFVKIFYIFAEN